MATPVHTAPRSNSRGFVLGYVLLGLAIASISLAVLARSGRGVAESRRMADLRDEIVSQASLIRAKLIACTVSYPGGDNGLGYRLQLPATPGSGKASDALCPGNPNTNKSIWTPVDGVYAPRALAGFGDWAYTHDATSARITITASSGGNVTSAALNNAALRFGTQASVVGNTMTVVIAN